MLTDADTNPNVIDFDVACEWFALCARGTRSYLTHPVLTAVPCCLPCATVVGEATSLKAITVDMVEVTA